MNSSLITSTAKSQIDKPLLQNLLSQSKPTKEFADIFAGAQSQTSTARDERSRVPDRDSRDDRSAKSHGRADNQSQEHRNAEVERSKADSDLPEPDAPAGSRDEGELEADPNTPLSGPSSSYVDEDGVVEKEGQSDGALVSAEGLADKVQGDIASAEEEGVVADTVAVESGVASESTAEDEGASEELVDLSIADVEEAQQPAVLSGAGVKADAVSSSPLAATALSRGLTDSTVASGVLQQKQQSGDPSSQVIEVEQLLSDKPVASAAISQKNTLEVGVKADSVMVNNDLLPGRIGANVVLSSESRLATKDALKDMLSGLKGAEAANKQSASVQLIPVGTDAKPLAPQSIQFQAAAARLPPGLQAAVGQPGWGQAVGERVLMMAAKNLQAAEIQLDPPELGQLQVRVVMSHDQASVSFVSPQQSVREALDESAQRLRDMFESEGVELTDVEVSDQSQSSLAQQESSESDFTETDESEEEGEALIQSVNMNLVDHYV